MMHTRQVSRDLEQNSALVRALRSLTLGDADRISEAVKAVGGGWSVQASDDYDGYLFVLIEPPAARAEQMPSYMVSGPTGQVELHSVRDEDQSEPAGRFANVSDLAEELTHRLRYASAESAFVDA